MQLSGTNNSSGLIFLPPFKRERRRPARDASPRRLRETIKQSKKVQKTAGPWQTKSQLKLPVNGSKLPQNFLYADVREPARGSPFKRRTARRSSLETQRPKSTLNRTGPERVARTPGIRWLKAAMPQSPPRVQPSGDPSAVAPPVPIPNTEVKRCSPDDSVSIGYAKVGRRQSYAPFLAKAGTGALVFPGGCKGARDFGARSDAGGGLRGRVVLL